MLEKIKVYLGIVSPDEDALLNLMIENAEASFADYTNQDAANFPTIIMKMVVEDYNRYGSEGINSLTFGSANEDVMADYSDGLKRQIRRHKKVKVI